MSNFKRTDELGLWMGFSTYESADNSFAKITLIPMVHVGVKPFYKEVKDEVFCHDIVLYEGAYVPLKKMFKWLYPLIALKTKLNFQGKSKKRKPHKGNKQQGFFPEKPNGPKVREIEYKYEGMPKRKIRQIIADTNKKQYLKSINKIPLRAKLAFPIILLGALILALFIVNRELLLSFGHEDSCKCKHCADDPVRGNKNIMDGFDWCMNQYKKYILEARDANLKNILMCELERHKASSKSIAVQYGEGHMEKLAATISELGFDYITTRWVLAVPAGKTDTVPDEVAGFGVAWSKFQILSSNILDVTSISEFSVSGGFYQNSVAFANQGVVKYTVTHNAEADL